MRRPTNVFTQLSQFFLIGGVVAAVAMKSWLPLIPVVLAVWTLLGFANTLERRLRR